jgi:GTPase
MFDQDYQIQKKDKVVLVSVTCPTLDKLNTSSKSQTSINELKDLINTLDLEYAGDFIQNRNHLDAGSIVGTGKLEEVKQFAKNNDVSLLIFDLELTAGQIRKIKKITGLDVIDRCHVILEIFARHARTRESKIQIEISRLEYLLPRLSGYWTHLSRQRGGVGVRGGEGEQQIELDRRIIRNRISQLKVELKEVINSKEQQGKKRKNRVLSAALIGYTNVGKSSLMNRLCHGNVLEENKLFATLDSTFRTLSPNTKPPLVLIDTVGFLNNLPNTLIDGFRTTLDSAQEADLLIIVCDVSNPEWEEQLKVTFDVMDTLKINEKEKVIVFNKTDLVEDEISLKIIKRRHQNSFLVSAYSNDDMQGLKKSIINKILERLDHFDVFIPYEHGHLHSNILKQTNILKTTNHDNGIFYRIRTPEFVFNQLGVNKYLLGPGHQYH